MATQFGKKQLKHPTPSHVLDIVRISTVILSTLLGWIQTVDFIPTQTVKIVSGIAGLLLAIGNGITPFFGVTPTSDTVPVEDVAAIETRPTPKDTD